MLCIIFKQVKSKFISIFFLFVFASATTEFGQFLKLPLLIQHFYSHQQKENMSLMEFFAEHYVGDHEDEDKKEDMQLPFKTVINGPSIVASFTITKMEVEKPFQPLKELTVPKQTSFIPSQLVFQIFHPPRTV